MDNYQSVTTADTANVPDSWPGAFGIFKYSKKAIQRNAWSFVGLLLLYIVVSAVFGSLGGDKSKATLDVGTLISSLIGVLLSTALAFVFVDGVRGKKLGIREALGLSLPLYFKSFALSVLTLLIGVISFILLIIPYFIIMPRLELALYFLIDKKLGPIDALKASWAATKGNVGKVWGIYGATLVMALLIVVIVGIYFVILYAAASAVLYVYLVDVKGAELPASATPSTPPQIEQ